MWQPLHSHVPASPPAGGCLLQVVHHRCISDLHIDVGHQPRLAHVQNARRIRIHPAPNKTVPARCSSCLSTRPLGNPVPDGPSLAILLDCAWRRGHRGCTFRGHRYTDSSWCLDGRKIAIARRQAVSYPQLSRKRPHLCLMFGDPRLYRPPNQLQAKHRPPAKLARHVRPA